MAANTAGATTAAAATTTATSTTAPTMTGVKSDDTLFSTTPLPTTNNKKTRKQFAILQIMDDGYIALYSR